MIGEPAHHYRRVTSIKARLLNFFVIVSMLLCIATALMGYARGITAVYNVLAENILSRIIKIYGIFSGYGEVVCYRNTKYSKPCNLGRWRGRFITTWWNLTTTLPRTCTAVMEWRHLGGGCVTRPRHWPIRIFAIRWRASGARRMSCFRQWLLPLLFAILPSSVCVKAMRLKNRKRDRRCPTCGYSLRASKDRCPECGTLYSPTERPCPAYNIDRDVSVGPPLRTRCGVVRLPRTYAVAR